MPGSLSKQKRIKNNPQPKQFAACMHEQFSDKTHKRRFKHLLYTKLNEDVLSDRRGFTSFVHLGSNCLFSAAVV